MIHLHNRHWLNRFRTTPWAIAIALLLVAVSHLSQVDVFVRLADLLEHYEAWEADEIFLFLSVLLPALWVDCVGAFGGLTSSHHPLAIAYQALMRANQRQAAALATHLEAEQQLKKQEAHLRAAQRIAQLGSWEWHLQTGETYWSEQVLQMFDQDRENGLSQFEDLQQRLHPADQTLHQQQIDQAIVTAQPYNVELRIYRSDGTLTYLQTRGEPITNANGETVQLVGTALDITERKQTQEQLRQYTAQLTASNQALEAFAHSVAHDLRTPLRAINGYSKLLMQDCGSQLDELAQDYLGRICHNACQMGLLIDGLLTLSQVSRTELDYAVVKLSHLAQEVITALRATAPERTVRVEIAPDIEVFADETLMRVVMVNLLQNAWKFTSRAAGARIEFGLDCSIPRQSSVYFVRDNGIGFDMAYHEKLFGVFEKIHDLQDFPGTGIGLATVQRVIRRHGGDIWAEGVVDQGATFYFTVPSTPLTGGGGS